MNGRPWYKRYPADFIAGTLQLSLEEKGAFSIVLDLIYDRGGPIPDDSAWIARACGCSVRKWNQIRETLLSENKIYTDGGLISNRRADKNVENERKTADKLAENGAKGAEKKRENKAQSLENNDLEKKGLDENDKQSRGQRPETREKDTVVSFSAPADVEAAFAMFNELAAKIGLPMAQVLNKTRAGRLAARLRDAGGLEGWAVALDKLAASDFCSGRKTDFKASLDFILQAESFTKLMEGNYDNGYRPNGPRPAAGANQARPASTYDAGMEGFSRAADRHAAARAGNGGMDGPSGNDAGGDLFAQGKGRTGKG